VTQHWKKVAVLSGLLAVGAVMRGIGLSQVPPILNRDEAALAYNAFLLMQTGMDEWQQQWPLLLKSFGDYKLVGYPVILSVFFRFLPLADWVVRLPAVLAGLSLVPLSYGLYRMLLPKQRWQWAALAAGLLSIAPVMIFYSRIGFEAMVGLALFVLATLLFLREQPRWDVAGLLVAALATTVYNTPLILLPLLIPLLVVRRGLGAWKRWLPLSLGIVVVFGGMFWQLQQAVAQKGGITIFGNPTTYHSFIEYREQLPQALLPVAGNQYVYTLLEMTRNFIASFDPRFLVTQGSTHPWHNLPQWGHIYVSSYVLGVGGVVVWLWNIFTTAWRKRQLAIDESSLLYLLGIGLVPAIITVDAPHATRSLFFFVIWHFAVASALRWLWQRASVVDGTWLRRGVLVAVIALQLVALGRYLHAWFAEYPRRYPPELLIGFHSAVQAAVSEYPAETIAVVDDEGYSYVIAAWYLRLSPEDFWQTVEWQNPDTAGLQYGEYVGNLHFIAQPDDIEKYPEELLLQRDEAGEWVLERR
jgi:hypothetical protein